MLNKFKCLPRPQVDAAVRTEVELTQYGTMLRDQGDFSVFLTVQIHVLKTTSYQLNTASCSLVKYLKRVCFLPTSSDNTFSLWTETA